MIDKIGPRRRSQSGMKQRLRISQALLSLATAGGLVLGVMVLAAPGQAEPPSEADTPSAVEESAEPTTEPSESADPENDVDAKQPSPKPTEEETSGESNVCDPLDSGKINVSGSVSSITVTVESLSLPPGSLIDEYCVKAGSANQGDGPHYESFAPTTSVTITYPGGKDISHYSVGWQSPLNGSFQIMKELMNPDEADVPETFAIDYECKMDDQVTKTGTENVPADAMGVSIDEVPVGSSCTITEQALPEVEGFTWAIPSYDPRSGVVDIESDEQTYVVKVINQIFKDNPGRGQLELAKELTGGPESYTGPFTLEYVCSKEGHDDVSGSRTVDAGSSAVISDIRPGSDCVVSEPNLPNPPNGYSFGEPTFDPSNSVTIKSKDKVTVTTENTLTRDEGNLRITKSLTGTPADFDPEFDVSYVCISEGEDTISGSTTVANGGTVEVPTEGAIPTGFECTVVEGALPALPAGYAWNTPGYSNNQGTDPGNVVTIVKNTVQLPDQELPVDQMATVAIANSATIPTVPVTPSSGGGVEVPTPATPVTPVEPASPVEPAVPVEPASPVEPAVPVEPASPDTPAAVEPAGVPLLVPAGGGAAAGIADDLPVVTYLLVILGMGSALAGAAYLLRSR